MRPDTLRRAAAGPNGLPTGWEQGQVHGGGGGSTTPERYQRHLWAVGCTARAGWMGGSGSTQKLEEGDACTR